MRRVFRLFLCLFLVSAGLSSCIFESPQNPENSDKDNPHISPNQSVLFLNIKSLVSASNSVDPAEKVNSLRIIIVGFEDNGEGEPIDSILECNYLIDNFPTVTGKGVDYTYTWPTTLGRKSIYVLANESSISDDITASLNEYAEGEDPGNLREWLMDFSFEPRYDTSGNSIYLPYSYFIDDFRPTPGAVTPVNCWLVPVATKFLFTFTNNRSDAVNIKGISMAYANKSSYLIPHLAEEELYREYDSSILYWADWLAQVSDESWSHTNFSDNDEFNKRVGWISDYSVPDPDIFERYVFVAENSSDVFTVDAATETEEDGEKVVTPGTHRTPVYYLPESVNYINPTDDIPVGAADDEEDEEYDGQRFYLTILLEDTGASTAPVLENVALPNLQALFRNTYVIVNVTMSEGDIEVYAEISPWTMKTANGFVSEKTDPPANNPFAIRRK